MTCEHIKIGDRTVIACNRGRKPKPKACSVCGRPSSLLCDFVVARPQDFGEAERTCDKPLCSSCSISGGPDLDYCPHHPRGTPAQHVLAL